MHPRRALTTVILVALTAACIATAARAYEVPETYLYAILATEGGHVGQAVSNKNGTSDLGPFQINTSWGQALAHFWNLPTTEVLDRVRDDGCVNAIAASAILKGVLNQARGDLPMALGLYHSHSTKLAESYREKVLSAAEKLTTYLGKQQK
jgi:soluble lytic murein transglycosylase-like protein